MSFIILIPFFLRQLCIVLFIIYQIAVKFRRSPFDECKHSCIITSNYIYHCGETYGLTLSSPAWYNDSQLVLNVSLCQETIKNQQIVFLK
jgi:hypothetical protein